MTEKTYPPVSKQIKTYMRHWVKKCQKTIRKTTPEEKNQRLEICNSCEFFDTLRKRCFRCGCFVNIKAQYWDEICPLNSWPMFSEKENKMRLFDNGLENSLVGLDAAYCDTDELDPVADVIISTVNPDADIFIVCDEEAVQKYLLYSDELGLAFVPNLFRNEVGHRPFTFFFQPEYNFNIATFFTNSTVYLGNDDATIDSHGNSGGYHGVFAAIKFCLYLGIAKLTIDVNNVPMKDRLKLDLRFKDVVDGLINLNGGSSLEINPFSFRDL